MTTRCAGFTIVLTALIAPFDAAAQTLPRPPVLAGCPTENLAFHTCVLQRGRRSIRPALRAGSPTSRATGAAC